MLDLFPLLLDRMERFARLGDKGGQLLELAVSTEKAQGKSASALYRPAGAHDCPRDRGHPNRAWEPAEKAEGRRQVLGNHGVAEQGAEEGFEIWRRLDESQSRSDDPLR
jgi:hypothetical protein